MQADVFTTPYQCVAIEDADLFSDPAGGRGRNGRNESADGHNKNLRTFPQLLLF